MSAVAMAPGEWVVFLGGLAAMGATISAGLIIALRPWLARYALARPSARGLHTLPTPQGGGVAVLVACAAVATAGALILRLPWEVSGRLAAVLGAAACLAALGLADDIRPLPPLPRLLIQLLAMAIGVLALSEGTRVLPFLPIALERGVLIIGGTWFVNLTNFMDGMDWITVADCVPLSVVLVFAWATGALADPAGLAMLGLFGGLLGYAPFNRPVARLFLGDVGSLPIGFLIAYALFSLAGSGTGQHLLGALILPLYAVADSGVTLLWRLSRGQRIWQPHRSHFYQVAVARGLTTWQVLARIIVVNLTLCLASWASLGARPSLQAAMLAFAVAMVALLLWGLSRGNRRGGVPYIPPRS